MKDLLRDIIADPDEYWPALLFFAGLCLVWAGLCASAVGSWRAKTQRRRFWLALGPLVLGLIGVLAEIPLAMEGGGDRVQLDLRWMFLLPLILGGAALLRLWRTRRQNAG